MPKSSKTPEAYLLYKSEFAEQKDIQYLTGFKGTTAVFLRIKSKNLLIVDTRYHEAVDRQTKKGVTVLKLSPQESAITHIAKILKKCKIREVAIEGYTPIAFVEKLKKSLGRIRGRKVRFETVPGLTLDARAVKTPKEIAAIERAQKLTAKIFSRILSQIRPGKQTELELAKLIREKAFEFGAEDISFPPIVAFGKNSASPHHLSSTQKIGASGPLLIDFGIRLGEYCSDFTRTIWIGKNPTKEFLDAYKTVYEAHKEGVRAAKFQGTKSAKEIDTVARSIIDSSRFKGTFIHGTGHGVGLEIHEKPSINPQSKDILRGSETITIEPGIYLPGKFGIRIEDVVVAGSWKVLGKSGTKLILL